MYAILMSVESMINYFAAGVTGIQLFNICIL